MKVYRLLIGILIFVEISCGKDAPSSSNGLSGKWVFQQQTTISGKIVIPNFINTDNFSNPPYIYNWKFTVKDSFNILFSSAGNYTFTFPKGALYPFVSPIYGSSGQFPTGSPQSIQWLSSNGLYQKINDSMLSINQDTSLLYFTYNKSLHTQLRNPYPKGNDISYRLVSNDSLVFKQAWIVSNGALSNDSLFFVITEFKKAK